MALFSNEKTDSQRRETGQTETVIGPSVRVEGNFEGQGDVVVEGTLQGTLKTTKNLRVGQAAVIKADVEALSIHCAGEIRGNVKAMERIDLTSSAQVHGNIETKQISIESGAVFNGKCLMVPEGSVPMMTKKPNRPFGQMKD